MEQLVEVPTVLFIVEQTVDIPVLGGGADLQGDLDGFFPEKESSAFRGAEHLAQQGFPQG